MTTLPGSGEALRTERVQALGARLGEEQLRAGAAGRQVADDLVAVEPVFRAPSRLARGAGDQLGDTTLQPVGQHPQAQQADRVAEADAVEADPRAHQLVFERVGVVCGRGPAADDDVQDRQREDDDAGEHAAGEVQHVAQHAAHEAHDVGREAAHEVEDAGDDPRGELDELEHAPQQDDGKREREERHRQDRNGSETHANHVLALQTPWSQPQPRRRPTARGGGRCPRWPRQMSRRPPCWEPEPRRFAPARGIPDP